MLTGWMGKYRDRLVKDSIIENAPIDFEEFATIVQGQRDIMKDGVAYLQCSGTYAKMLDTIVSQALSYRSALEGIEVDIQKAAGIWSANAVVRGYNTNLALTNPRK